ncbi:MAG: sodium:solute symporter, partial [Bacteroidales bacterium]|nr:sodium:solute symporter [Bacteroidales bacterium]
PLNSLFGWNIKTVIILSGMAVMLYSMIGGIKAVLWTDAIQGLILITGAVTCALFITFSMPEGPEQLFRIAIENKKFSLGSFGTSLKESTFWVILIYGLFINLQNFGIDQNYIQRYMASKSDKSAKRSTLFGSLLYLPVSLVFFYIGTALFSYYTSQPGLLPESLNQPGSADKVFPYFIVNSLPAGLTGLLIASIFAAGMSTVSTSLNSSATIILTDYFRKFSAKKLSLKHEMSVLYASSFGVGTAGIIIALLLVGVESVLDAWWALASVFSGGMLGLFLMGYLVRKASNKDAIAGIIAGIIIIAWMSLSPVIFKGDTLAGLSSQFNPNLAIVFGTSAIFLTGFLSAILFNRNRKKNL